MRDRLIGLLDKVQLHGVDLPVDRERYPSDEVSVSNERIADHLLANGVIVPPCMVGDTVHVPWVYDNQKAVATVTVEEVRYYDSKKHCMFYIDMGSDDENFNQSFGGWKVAESIGSTVFLTKKEAEKALAERI